MHDLEFLKRQIRKGGVVTHEGKTLTTEAELDDLPVFRRLAEAPEEVVPAQEPKEDENKRAHDDLTVPELREIAEGLGITPLPTRKADLLEAIYAAEAAKRAGDDEGE